MLNFKPVSSPSEVNGMTQYLKLGMLSTLQDGFRSIDLVTDDFFLTCNINTVILLTLNTEPSFNHSYEIFFSM